ncbi:MAG: hypothetical protein PHP31_05820 [Lentimicrobiaceae bacterium]|nr:hypothetical protein [Lentimicrobiaceae bacterium]
MAKYNEKLDALFEEWKKEFEKNGHTGFCYDGLMYRGKSWKTEDGKKTYYGKGLGDENSMWLNAEKRILFLLKEPNKNPDQDTREFFPGANYGSISRHYKNIAYWLFGLISFKENNNAPEFGKIDFWEDVFPVFDTEPYAIVNCKKESGGSKTDAGELSEHMQLYADFTRKEIEILNPDIIVCGGGSNSIKNFVKQYIYPDIEKISDNNNWIYYSKKENKVVINSYHPSYFGIKIEEMYTRMMSAYKEFLEKYPNFRKSSRK